MWVTAEGGAVPSAFENLFGQSGGMLKSLISGLSQPDDLRFKAINKKYRTPAKGRTFPLAGKMALLRPFTRCPVRQLPLSGLYHQNQFVSILQFCRKELAFSSYFAIMR